MKQPMQITFHGLQPSAAVEAAARDKAGQLDRFCPDIMACRVGVRMEHKHHHQGNRFTVRIDITLPGHELAVDRIEHEDVHVALRDAFDAMRRRLQDTVRRARGEEKEHTVPLHGTVARLNNVERYGFITTPQGDDYYFAPENLEGASFDRLEVGAEVQFLPDVAAEGRQAKRVSLGKHRFV